VPVIGARTYARKGEGGFILAKSSVAGKADGTHPTFGPAQGNAGPTQHEALKEKALGLSWPLLIDRPAVRRPQTKFQRALISRALPGTAIKSPADEHYFELLRPPPALNSESALLYSAAVARLSISALRAGKLFAHAPSKSISMA
jgi:hypothetical protein